jgi:hypothetical protein
MGHFTANEKACFEVMYAHSARVNNRKRVVVISPNSRVNNEPFYLQCNRSNASRYRPTMKYAKLKASHAMLEVYINPKITVAQFKKLIKKERWYL